MKLQKPSLIQKTPDVCGGYARIRNTRIPVWTLVSLRQQGAKQELLNNYPSLILDDLSAVWGYYYHNKSEINRIIAE